MSTTDRQLIENGKVSLRIAVLGSWGTAMTVAAACGLLYKIETQLDSLSRSRWTYDMQLAYEHEREKAPYSPVDVVTIHERYKPE